MSLFLRSKANVFSTFKTFVAYVETQFSTYIKILRSDSSGEYGLVWIGQFLFLFSVSNFLVFEMILF
jgi:hypothetical protein